MCIACETCDGGGVVGHVETMRAVGRSVGRSIARSVERSIVGGLCGGGGEES